MSSPPPQSLGKLDLTVARAGAAYEVNHPRGGARACFKSEPSGRGREDPVDWRSRRVSIRMERKSHRRKGEKYKSG